jgi:peptide/nickel transport system substrate-binding protein
MKRIFLVLCLMAMAVGMTASAQSNPDVLVWSLVGGDISTLNPALITDGNSNSVAGFLFNGLSKPNKETGLPEPDLATWEVSDDGLTYTFTLKDVNWSDGTPITANDVKFTYDAIMSDLVQSPRTADMANIASVEVVDDKTLVVTLSQADCTIWGGAFASFVPLPSSKFAADFSDFMENPFNTAPDVVSGQYVFVEHSAGEFVRLEANPAHYQGQPEIPALVFRIIADPPTQNQALETDSADYAFMYPDQFAQITTPDKLGTFLYPNANTPILSLNWQDTENPLPAYDEDGNPNTLVPNKFFGDVRVRQAVAMGYDKAALALTLGENSGSEPLTGPITPAFYSTYDMSAIQPWPYDPEAAKALLEEAGWVDSDGDGIREKDGVVFEVDLTYSPLVDLWANIATVAQDQLGQIGIKVNVNTMEWSAYLSEVVLPYKYDMTVVGFGGGTEVDGIAYNLLHSKNVAPNNSFNFAGYVNPEMDELLDTAKTLAGCSAEERGAIYAQIQQMSRDDVAYDWTVSTTQVHVLNNRVDNAQIGQWDPFLDVYQWGLGG